jgi:peptide/nickel transport system substrate-binding protein
MGERGIKWKIKFIKESSMKINKLGVSLWLLITALCLTAFTGCQGKSDSTPLVVGYSSFNGKFSPFFADTGYDTEAVEMTQVILITTDRQGGIVYNAIEGETLPYNGTDYEYKGIANLDVNYDEAKDETVYTWTLKKGVKFSDGVELTADDVIFSYYVLSDPTYDGPSTLYSVPIRGMNNYRTQVSEEAYKTYGILYDAISAAGKDHVWSESDEWTKEQQDLCWATTEKVWKEDVQAIVDYCMAEYLDYSEDYTGFTAEELKADPAKQIVMGMALWGFGTVENGVLTSASGVKFNLSNKLPTLDDYYNECVLSYNTIADYAAVESPGVNAAETLRIEFIKAGVASSDSASSGVPTIEGIKKISDYEVQITVEGFDAAAVYKLGVTVAPLHYYGDKELYDYDANQFGFTFGDLSEVRNKTSQPLGAGPYRFIKYENKVIYFEANKDYYKGTPATYNVQFKETNDADKISGVGTSAIDLTDPAFGSEAVDEIKSYNSNGEINGDTIVTNTVDNLGYGYIGINADTVNVAGIPDSEESKNLRRAFATLLAAYRSLSIDSYYGERASVINYPISNTSWAAPQKSDEGYEIAFSQNLNKEPIYTSSMNSEEKFSAALEASKEYFIAAGYTYNEAQGIFTAAPQGAKLEYEIIVPADGAGDHPSYKLAEEVRKALETIGITLIVNDPSDSNVLWDKLDAETQELWAAAWVATIDPDMYQVYHSDNSTHFNHYHIADSKLDELIIEARTSDDQAFRKATYKACLDTIIDWAVEIPVYQRQNCIIISAERIQLDSVTPDITTFWVWIQDIENLKMVK